MRIFLAGGTGVIGRGLVPALVAAGHDVVAMTRREDRLERLAELGARGVVADAYDADRLTEVMRQAMPDVVLHELTDLGEADLEANARLRRVGTANLVAAAEAASVERIVVESISWVYAAGEGPAVETEALEPGTAVEEMELLARRLPHATVLRYGLLYGPGTWYAPGARMAEAVAAGEVAATPSVSSFVHIDDAVSATVQALEWPDGPYNIVDDEPAAANEWLPAFAAAVGARAPEPTALSPGAVAGRGASNAKARSRGWEPRWASWREGFQHLAE